MDSPIVGASLSSIAATLTCPRVQLGVPARSKRISNTSSRRQVPSQTDRLARLGLGLPPKDAGCVKKPSDPTPRRSGGFSRATSIGEMTYFATQPWRVSTGARLSGVIQAVRNSARRRLRRKLPVLLLIIACTPPAFDGQSTTSATSDTTTTITSETVTTTIPTTQSCEEVAAVPGLPVTTLEELPSSIVAQLPEFIETVQEACEIPLIVPIDLPDAYTWTWQPLGGNQPNFYSYNADAQSNSTPDLYPLTIDVFVVSDTPPGDPTSSGYSVEPNLQAVAGSPIYRFSSMADEVFWFRTGNIAITTWLGRGCVDPARQIVGDHVCITWEELNQFFGGFATLPFDEVRAGRADGE